MAIFRGQKVRGEQIKDRTVAGGQILQGSLLNEHIATDAAIAETKINIDWAAHTETLVNRKVVDYVQVNSLQVSGTSFDLEAAIPDITGIAVAGTDNAIEGIIASGSKNYAPMRSSINGEPIVVDILDLNYEVIARVEDVAGIYTLKFYTASGTGGAEVPYDLGATPITVDIQYARRFNLRDIDEMFAANEKFVHGAADVTSHLNLEQLAKDIYGTSWTLDRDGSANLVTSLKDQLAAEANRAQIAETGLSNAIDSEKTLRISADGTLQNAIDAEATRAIAAEDAINIALTAETTRATGAETTLQANIDAEAATRLANDNTLQGNIAAEATARQTADTTLQSNINAEAATRLANDNAIQTELNTTQGGAGLNADGTYSANNQATYINTATSLKDADEKLDASLKVLATTVSNNLSGNNTAIDTIQTELNTTQTGAGLNTDGTYSANTTSNYLTGATSLYAADQLLDDQLEITNAALTAEIANRTTAVTNEATARANADNAIQAELDATQTGAGLTTGGAYTQDTNANYIDTATSLYNADQKLDAALKTTNDALAAEITNRETAISNEAATRLTSDQALQTALNTEITNRTNADTAILTDLASTVVGKGASTVGISPITGMDGVTTVQSAIEYLKTNSGDALVTYKADVASTESGKGASLVGVSATSGLNASTVQGVLVDHETRLDTLESLNAGASDRAATINGYFAAGQFATVDARLESSEGIVDTNLKRIDDRDISDRSRTATTHNYFTTEVKTAIGTRFIDIENVVDATAYEVEVARGSKTNLNERLSVAVRADGFLVDDHKLHAHKKYTLTISTATSVINLPVGEKFNKTTGGSGTVVTDSVQVYINGILQANGINFTEIVDDTDATKGVGVNFTPEELIVGDVVVLEWVVNNANF